MEILAGIYVGVAIAFYVIAIKQMKKRAYVDFEDLFFSFILFGIAWPVGIPIFCWLWFGLGDKILHFVNKK